jgi:hypothetical protein
VDTALARASRQTPGWPSLLYGDVANVTRSSRGARVPVLIVLNGFRNPTARASPRLRVSASLGWRRSSGMRTPRCFRGGRWSVVLVGVDLGSSSTCAARLRPGSGPAVDGPPAPGHTPEPDGTAAAPRPRRPEPAGQAHPADPAATRAPPGQPMPPTLVHCAAHDARGSSDHTGAGVPARTEARAPRQPTTGVSPLDDAGPQLES